jgi:hypothetical protein
MFLKSQKKLLPRFLTGGQQNEGIDSLRFERRKEVESPRAEIGSRRSLQVKSIFFALFYFAQRIF